MDAPITFDQTVLDEIRERTVLGTLGVEFVEVGPDRVVLALEVGPRVHQPYGFLHGGVSALLSETCASIGAWLAAGVEHEAFGLEINANHLRPVRAGRITATGPPIRNGRTIAVWDTRIEDAAGKLVCVSRCTVALRPAGSMA
ncbi:MAG: thioesterase superfamily protein [Thermoleophilia bacterium]|nr:thioesterase superfamily protein [Thermoleophilia bacterium]